MSHIYQTFLDIHFSLDMGLDIQDEMGRHEVSFQENIDRTPTEDGGNEIDTS